jgi:acyl-homoserine lactone acylase PvdQ
VSRWLLLSMVTAALTAGLAGAAAEKTDYAGVAYDILVPGENGSVQFDANTDNQAKLYDALTPLWDKVTAADLARYYKPNRFGASGKVEPLPRRDVRIVRDGFGVAHVNGKTRAAVWYGAGWVAAEDRGLLMELLRSAGRLSAIDAPGFNAFAVALSGRHFESSPQTEAFLSKQFDLVRAQGPEGRQALADIDAFLRGLNAYNRKAGLSVTPWTRNDVLAVATVIAARFGAGGGDEARRSEFLSALRAQMEKDLGDVVFTDLSELDDADAPVSVPGQFPFRSTQLLDGPGAVALDDGSVRGSGTVPASAAAEMSNAILVGASRSATGHPILVAGPQLGYYFPEVALEYDLHGGGIDVRGMAVPGLPYVVIGRGKDFAWSATSSQTDIVDTFAESLCGGDDLHYLYKGTCRAMTTFDAGVLKGAPGQQDTPVVFHETVHGPVMGYATVQGVRVALAQERSTRGREAVNLVPFMELNENVVRSPQTFVQTMSKLELAFNWFYADWKHIAFFSSARMPVRAPGTAPELPTAGTGEYDWRGFATPAQHPQSIDPPSGYIVNWNNRPARGFGAADDNWSYGSVQRVQLLAAGFARKRKLTPAQVVSIMNKAATQDLRAVVVLPSIAAVLKTAPAPNPRTAQMLSLLEAWATRGGSRLDRDLDGRIDDPGAAILDAVWPRVADAVLRPRLGPLTARLAELMEVDDAPGPAGSAYLDGWYGYVDKDLRQILARPVRSGFARVYCAGGDGAGCRDSLWAAFDAAGAELAAAQGPDPAAWRADATKERIRFAPGILTDTMRWANRSTFQQVISFTGHR